MPYKDKEKQREFQKLWMRQRRAEYLKDKCCALCQSTEELGLLRKEVYRQKRISGIWGARAKKKELALENCIVLCHECLKREKNKTRTTGVVAIG